MQQRARETRASVLLAAARVFDAHGYAGASIDQIAQEGGLTKGALYFHFESKSDLALAVVNANYEIWLRLQAEVEERELSPLDRIGALLTEVAVCFRDDVMIRGGMRLNSDRDAIPAPLPEPFRTWIEYFTPVLAESQAQGDVRADLDPAALARMMVSCFFGVQLVCERLCARADVLERTEEWWETYMLPVMSAAVVAR
jgi:AcrR family transcriptional regulator